VGRRHEDAILIRGTRVCLVIPQRGDAFYVRPGDGAIGRRRGDTMFWHVLVEENLETMATEEADQDILALDEIVARLDATIASFKSGR
jgi:hypothetical protein